ncbi:cytochrome P450 [Streptomyces sp. AJS327]|uniref:cytochrome P450 n=1 Tax=Streptomyces sp. AJS327 TaxID=2545265 RepID=UPI0015DD9332|nr:cytochrome P450 [Streptomyces sp. AJS327]
MHRPDTHPVAVPGAWPLLGHLPQMARAPLAFFQGLERHGPLAQIRIWSRPMVVVTRPDLARRVLVTGSRAFDKGGPVIEGLRTLLGNGLVTCPAHEHTRQRHLMQPAFHPLRLARYSPAVSTSVADVVGSWRPGQAMDLDREIGQVVSLIVSRTLVAAPGTTNTTKQICDLVPEATVVMYRQGLMPGRLLPRLPLSINRRCAKVRTEGRDLIAPVLARYRAGHGTYADLLSDVVRAYENEPDPDLAMADQAMTIVGAALETTASSLVWTLRLLAEHPRVLARLTTELDEVLAGRQATHDDIARLPYLQQVLTESMRLYPPVWLMTRTTTSEVRWAEGSIPAGTDVGISPWALHRDPGIFPSPEAFAPDRWAPERATSTQREAFFALGAGRRKCIGDTFAMNAAVIILSTILTRWHLHHQRSQFRIQPRMLLTPPRTPVTVQARALPEAA